MCGISALFSPVSPQPLVTALRAMTDVVRHRGPDGEGFFVVGPDERPSFFAGPDTGADIYEAPLAARPERSAPPSDRPMVVGLGHRRLAILDRSPAGHQPMMTPRGEVVIVFNGEIYNHDSIRDELRNLGHSFVGHSDTEVILHAYQQWGPDCLRRFNGMFSFVLFEPRSRRVFIARDRYGVKPLYLWQSPRGLVAVASEIKQFTVLPGWTATLDAQRAYDYLKFGITDHDSSTMFAGVMQLRGGEYIHCTLAGLAQPAAQVRRWYELTPSRVTMGFDAAAEQFRELFTDSVSLRLHADVPVGTGLSGGLDSSSIVCTANQLLRAQDAAAEQNTFSACSELKQYDERHHIDRVVEHTGVRAHYTYPAIEDFFRTLPTLLWHHDEPFEGTSVFAEWCVYRLTATTPVKVTLDGHGADELLAGYHTFFGHSFAQMFWRGSWLQLSSEMRATQARHGYGARFLLSSIATLGPLGRLAYSVRRRRGHASAQTQWMETAALGIDDYDLFGKLGGKQVAVNDFSVSQLLATSLPFQLRTCDRDSMAHSIESRAPFLDYRLVEFALGCPQEFKLADGTTKRLLRTAMRDVLPTGTLQRQDKMGFVTPEEFWVRQGEAARFRALVDAAVQRASGIVNGQARERALRIIDGHEPFSPFVLRLVLFANWLDVFKVAVR